MGLTKAQEKTVRDLPDHWARNAKVETAAAEATDLVIGWVRSYNYGEDEIRALLDQTFTHVINIARAAGQEEGAERERETNPAIKSVGSAVAVARRKDREATRATLDEVFQREAARGNPFYAFNEALKAIE